MRHFAETCFRRRRQSMNLSNARFLHPRKLLVALFCGSERILSQFGNTVALKSALRKLGFSIDPPWNLPRE